MKKLNYLLITLLAFSLTFASCKKEDGPDRGDLDEIVEDGFYVVGEATASVKLVTNATMAAGINEVGQEVRNGMYEKYIALEGGKPFSLLLKKGTVETKYGANLENVDLAGENDQPDIVVQRGELKEDATLQVANSGLYHIVLDLNLSNDLDYAQIVIAPVQWGMRGGFNGWGFTEMTASSFNKEEMKFTLAGAELKAGQSFKFAYGGGWKIELDHAELVKANTNLGTDMIPGGGDLAVDEHGVYTVTLTWNLKEGSVADAYSVRYDKTGDLEVEEATGLFMIGDAFGEWDWGSDGVVEMTPVHSADGAFWAIRYIEAGSPFKWAPGRAGADDFSSLETNEGFEISDNNAVLAESGIYMVYIDLGASKIVIERAKVYGMGDAFGGWDGEQEANLFAEVDGKLQATTSGAGELRMYAFTSAATTDWWTREFIILDGKIEYRADGDDQERVNVSAGAVVTLDFNAGTGGIN